MPTPSSGTVVALSCSERHAAATRMHTPLSHKVSTDVFRFRTSASAFTPASLMLFTAMHGCGITCPGKPHEIYAPTTNETTSGSIPCDSVDEVLSFHSSYDSFSFVRWQQNGQMGVNWSQNRRARMYATGRRLSLKGNMIKDATPRSGAHVQRRVGHFQPYAVCTLQ